YVPGDRPRPLAKAREIAADAVIIDLEDAVAPDAKEEGRRTMQTALAEGGYACELVARVNGIDTEWASEDIVAAVEAGADAVLVPKISSAADVRTAARLMHDAGAPERMRLWAMIETPLALLNLAEIAACAAGRTPRLGCFVIGTNDLAVATRARLTPGREAFVPWFAQIVAAAHAYGIDVIDGVLNDYSDTARLEAECRQARDLGMDGKSLIHPSQIEAANRLFSPSAEELEEARAIVEAFARPENAGKGVVGVSGKMAEIMHLRQAERILKLAEGG
ncbi:MAG TPA: CoA ester lyase, partial [Afifellaceae bacterium]|nr:CoA ester lyase [Afifellaceae bacterium]